jgi:hypothetical protein
MNKFLHNYYNNHMAQKIWRNYTNMTVESHSEGEYVKQLLIAEYVPSFSPGFLFCVRLLQLLVE